VASRDRRKGRLQKGERAAIMPRAACCNAARYLLQKRNSKFFSLEYRSRIAIIRDAMASNKTDTYGHKSNPAFQSLAPYQTTTPWGSNESAKE
jgi:hypothetical protein